MRYSKYRSLVLSALLSLAMGVSSFSVPLKAETGLPDETGTDNQEITEEITDTEDNGIPETISDGTEEVVPEEGNDSGEEVLPDEQEGETVPENAEGEAELKKLVADNDRYEVVVFYDDEAEIPEGSELVLTEYKEEDEEFQAAKEALVADEDGNSAYSQSTEEEQENLGMAAFDLTIYDAEGNIVEPKTEVKVNFTLKEVPLGVDVLTLASSMEIQHLNDSTGDVVVEKIATFDSEEAENNDTVGEVKVDGENEIIEVETVVEGFSTYTITWTNAGQDRNVILHFVDDQGNELDGFTYNGVSIDNGSTNLATLIPGNEMFDLNNFKKEGYSLSNTHIDTIADVQGNTPTIIRNEVQRADNNLHYWTFNTGNDTAGVTQHNFPTGDTDLYLVYNSTDMASPGGGGGGGGDTPSLSDLGHTKNAVPNNDGTYKLTLSVTGSAASLETDPHVNVIVVFDTSSSMVSHYIPDSSSMTRLEAAKVQINQLATDLLANNTPGHEDAVEMALVTFNRDANIESMGAGNWTTDPDVFKGVVGTYTDGPLVNNNEGTSDARYNTGVDTAKGTNWAQALQKTIDLMQDNSTDDDPTYVLFITDGAPSQYWPSGQATGTYAEGEGCYLGARDEARRLVGGEGAILYALFTYGSQADYNRDYLGKLVDYAYNEDDAKAEYRFNVADNEAFKQKLKEILDIINLNFAYANVKVDDGVTGLSTVVFERIDSESFTYEVTYKDYSTATQYEEKTAEITVNSDGTISLPSIVYKVPDRERLGGLKTITTKAVTITGATYDESSKSVLWDMKKVVGDGTDFYLLEEGWTYTVQFDIWPSQASYDLVAQLNNHIIEYGDPYTYTDENGHDVTVPFDVYKTQVTNTEPYTLLTNSHFNITYQQVKETVNPDGSSTYEFGPEKTIVDPYTYEMPLEIQKMPVKKEFAHAINEQDPYTSIRFYLMMDGKYYQTDGTLSDTLVPKPETASDEPYTICMDLPVGDKWEDSIFIAPGVIKDTRTDEGTGKLQILETGHAYSLYEEILSGDEYEYEFTPQTVRPMVINGVLTYLIKEDKYNKPESESVKTYEIDGDVYFEAQGEDAQALIGTNRKTAELDITKIVDDPDDLLTKEQETKETFTYRVTLKIPDGTDPAGIVGYEYIPRTQDNAYLLHGYQQTDKGKGFPEDVARFNGKTYRAWNTLAYRDLVEWENVDGHIRSKKDEDGNIIWKVPAVDGYHTITYDMTLKQDEVIRFTNLPSGTKYTIQEIYANKYPADNVGGTTSGRPPVEDPSNLAEQGYAITRIQSTGVNEGSAELSDNIISGEIKSLDTRYYNQFTNTISDVVDAELLVTKHLDGYEWDGERYYFDLKGESGTTPLPGANGGRTSLYTTAEDGSADVTQSFGRIRFSKTGTYTYTIQERTPTVPDPENPQPSDRRTGIIYDTSEKTVTIVVDKDQDGHLFIDSITGEDGTDLTVDLTAKPASGTVKVTNSRERGNLDVKKTVVSDAAADLTKDFAFKVTLGDTTINGTYGDVKFTNGVAEFTLKHNSTKSITGLPTGITYTVEETAYDGFTTTYEGKTGTISTTKVTATVTNTRTTGNLKLSKKLISDAAADKNVDFTFTVTLSDKSISKTYGDMAFENGVATVKLKGGASATATGLPTGITYTITEAEATGFRLTGKTGDEGSISTELAEAEFTNTRDLGDLDVTKTVVSDAIDDLEKDFSFKVTLGDTTINGTYGDVAFTNGVAEFTLKHDGIKHITGLPTGITYTVEETADDGFTTTYEGKTGTISTTLSTAAVTNTRKKGGLDVKKTVVSDAAADQTKDFAFKVTLGDITINGTYGEVEFKNGVAEFTLKHDGIKHITDLPTGITYTVEETADDGFTTTYEGETGTISTELATATVTNTRKTGGLDVKKTVVSDAAADKTKEFSFTVTLGDTSINGTYGDVEFTNGVASFTLKHDVTKHITGLPTGITYTVEETADDGFTTTYEGKTGTISTELATATVTNTRKTGDLDVKKTVASSTAGDKTKEFSFKVTLSDTTISGTYGEVEFTDGVAEFTLTDSQTKHITGLPTGVTYTVEEETDAGFVTTKTGDTGTIKTELSTATFTNTRKEGGLVVKKVVSSPIDADKNLEFTFKVTLDDKTVNGKYGGMTFENGVATFKLKDGQSVTATGLAAGLEYTVEETAVDNFTITYDGKTGEIVEGDEPKVATVTNTHTPGELDVTKTVESDRASDYEQVFTFKVTLGDTTINATFDGVEFVNGVAIFTLKHSETQSITGLPTGITYKVEEDTAEGFTTTKTGDTGSITTETATAAFTNTRKTGDLDVKKTVVSDASADMTKEFNFKVTLSDTSINKTYNGVEFKNGVAEFTLKHNETKNIKGLPTGITYTVEEETDAGFTTTKTGDTGSITTETATAAFTNTRKTGDLDVKKTVESDASADKTKEFNFKVTLSDTSINKTYNGVEFKNGVAEFTLKHNETKSIKGLPTGITYTVEEETDDGFTTTKTGETGSITTETATAAFTNTRKTGDLDVKKTVVSDATADKTKEFTFKVTLGDTTINGTYGDVEFADGATTFTLKHDETKSITGLPTDVSYTVEEETAKGFVTTKTGDTGTIATEKATAVFTNTRETGNLTVKKTVASDTKEDERKDFNFIVTLSDTGINGTYGDMEFTDGVAEFTLKHKESKTAEGLPTEIGYIVEEEADDRFVTTVTNDKGTIEKDKDAVVEFTNIFIDIKVKKVDDKNNVVKGAVLAVKDEEGKIVDQWTTDGTVHQIENLLPDTKYTLTELKVPEGYEKSPDITFMTDSTGKAQALQMVDKKKVIPDTSDHDRTPGWTISMIMSLLMAGLAFATRRKYGFKN